MKTEKITVTEEIVKTVEKEIVTIQFDPGEVAMLWHIALHLRDKTRFIQSDNVGFSHNLTEDARKMMADLDKQLEDQCPKTITEGWKDGLVTRY